MIKYIRHIVLALVATGLFGSLNAQDMTLVIPSDLKINSNTYKLKLNDEVQFYYDSIGVKLVLAATKTWTGNDLTYLLPRNTASIGQNGPNSSGRLYLKILDAANNCKLINSAIFSSKNGTGIYTFVPGRIDTIKSVSLAQYGIRYSKDTLCSDTTYAQVGGALIDPYKPFASIISSPLGLNIAANGDISYAGSTAGKYQVRVNYKDYCISGNDYPITVLPQLNLSTSNLAIEPNACGKSNGLIQVRLKGIYEPVTYIFSQNNSVINNTTSNVLVNLLDGVYGVRVTDKYGCTDSVTATLNCVTPAPDMQLTIPNVFQLDDYSIKNFDLIEIYYDSLGNKRKLVSAQYWQGNDLKFSLPSNYAPTGKNGFADGDRIYLKVFDEQNNCRLELDSMFSGESELLFQSGANKIASRITGGLANFSYATDTVCTGALDLQVKGINDPVTLLSLGFTSNPAGLDISSMGSILYQSSIPGTYSVSVKTRLCKANNGQIPMTILPQLPFTSQDFILVENDCGLSNGKITVKTPAAAYQPVSYSVFLNGGFFPADAGETFDSLAEGTYVIKIKDRYNCSGTSPDLVLNCTPLSDGMVLMVPDVFSAIDFTITKQDSVQIYFDSLGIKKKMVASQIYTGKNLRFILPRNTLSTGKNGFNEGDTIFMKIKDFDKNCLFDNITANTQNDYILFANKTIKTAELVSGFVPTFRYELPDLCTGKTTVVRGRGTATRIIRTNYNYVSTFGLNLDNATGEVTWAGSEPGSYSVLINTSSCVTNNSLPITIHKPISISNSELQITPPDCGQNNGSVEVGDNITNGTPPYLYLFSKSGVAIFTSIPNKIENAESGSYSVFISDRNRCIDSLNFSLDCIPAKEDVISLTANHILSNTNPKYAEVRIECDQQIKILNRAGRIVKNLAANAIWSGTDNNNAELPNGLYIVYCGEKRLGEVTILK